jgi:predicted DNA-binding transcriptional regulator AlpA
MNDKVALTELQVAEWLGLSVATLRAWRFRQKGPTFVRFGRAVRYLPSDIELFIQQNRVDTDADAVPDLEAKEVT